MKTTHDNQYLFEMVRDFIRTVEYMKIGQTISFEVIKKGDLHTFSCDQNMHCGWSEVSNALKVAYEAAVKEFYHEQN